MLVMTAAQGQPEHSPVPVAPEITALLRAVEGGDRAAVDQLFTTVYAELKRIAQRQLREAPIADTLNTTALVHEAYLKLSANAGWSTRDRFHFFALTAHAMRQVLIDHARRRSRHKRGGRQSPLALEEVELAVAERADELVALDQALGKLERVDPELARLVEWRFFAGLSVEEVAELLAVSERTVKRHFRMARAFLYQEMAAQGFGA
jgi:RNA polymerase sigma factor (TIGR02999 family)